MLGASCAHETEPAGLVRCLRSLHLRSDERTPGSTPPPDPLSTASPLLSSIVHKKEPAAAAATSKWCRLADGTAVPRFYMYSDAALDHHGWLHTARGCAVDPQALRHGAEGENTAEVGLRRTLHRHPARTVDPHSALFFYLPIFEFTSWRAGNCSGVSHLDRMRAAHRALQASAGYVLRNGSRGHLFASTAWSTGRASTTLLGRMNPLSRLLHWATVGRYKQMPRRQGSTRAAVGVCVLEVPYQASLAATRLGERSLGHRADAAAFFRRKRALLFFAGSLDVCCAGVKVTTHRRERAIMLKCIVRRGDDPACPHVPMPLPQVRCAVGELMARARGQADVTIRATGRGGPCTDKARALMSSLHNSSEGFATARKAPEKADGRFGGGRYVNASLVEAAAAEMGDATYCLAPAGDTRAHRSEVEPRPEEVASCQRHVSLISGLALLAGAPRRASTTRWRWGASRWCCATGAAPSARRPTTPPSCSSRCRRPTS